MQVIMFIIRGKIKVVNVPLDVDLQVVVVSGELVNKPPPSNDGEEWKDSE
jgi:hypothetical protein